MIVHLKRSIELNPDHADALNFLGYTYAEQGMNLDEALDLVKRAVELKPDNGYITDSLGWVYYRKGLYHEAIIQLERAASLVKEDPVILDHLGDAYFAASSKEKALEAWRQALQLQKLESGLRARIEEKIRKLTAELNP
jgi:tetratricopeptide (TPR) repeat protein